MNDRIQNLKRREEDMKYRQYRLAPERLKDYLLSIVNKSNEENKIIAVQECVDALSNDLCNNCFSLNNFYKTLDTHKLILNRSEYIRLIYNAEDLVLDAIKNQENLTWKRRYIAENESIKDAGYEEGKIYIISYPNNPELKPEKWIITEFKIYGDGIIQPLHGCKMKKDGNPSRKAQFISMPRDVKFKLEITEPVK